MIYVVCPRCGSQRMVKAGRLKDIRFNYNKQRFQCKDCRHYTVNPKGSK